MSDNEAEKTLVESEIKKGLNFSSIDLCKTIQFASLLLSELDENIELISLEKMEQGSPEIWNEKSS